MFECSAAGTTHLSLSVTVTAVPSADAKDKRWRVKAVPRLKTLGERDGKLGRGEEKLKTLGEEKEEGKG